MKKPLLKLITLGLLIVPNNAFADYEYEVSDFGIKYIINQTKGEASAIGPADDTYFIQDLYIQDEINGYPVTAIADYAFANYSLNASNNGYLTIGNNIRVIGNSAFADRTFNGDLSLPSSLKEIGESSFHNCIFYNPSGELIFPDGIEKIGSNAFGNFQGYNGSIVLPNSIKELGPSAFSYSSFRGSLTLPEEITAIPPYSFCGCAFSGQLVLPKNLAEIGEYAFAGCSFIGELKLPESITTIGANAFSSFSGFYASIGSQFSNLIISSENPPICTNTVFNSYTYQNAYLIVPESSLDTYKSAIGWKEFENITTSSTVSTADIGIVKYLIDTNKNEAVVLGIADGDFPFTDLVIPNDITFKGRLINVVRIVPRAFESLYFSGTLSLGKNIKTIGNNAFQDCARFTGPLKLPTSLTYIGPYAFNGCSGLNGELTLPNSLTEIPEYAFAGCSRLTGQLKLPSELKSIQQGAFANCKGFTGQLYLPSGITELGDNVFIGCSGFTGLLLPSNLSKIANGTFSGCSSIKGPLSLPQSLTEIGNYCFRNCNGLSGDLKIPESVTKIGSEAFSGCSGLDGTLTFPSKLEEIPSNSFEKCSFSGVLIIPESVHRIGYRAFADCKSLSGTLEIPESIKWIEESSFEGCKGLEAVVLPEALDAYDGMDKSSIQKSAFSGCNGLTRIISRKQSAPTCNDWAFDNSTYSKATLYVPTNALRSYQTTDPWRKFASINSLEPLTAIEFFEPNVICPLGGTVRLYLKKSPAGATGDITFISGNTAVATVDANGVVTGVAKGSTAIIAMSGTLTASCVVTVEDPTVPATALNYKGIIANVGESVAIGAEVLPADVTDPTINWTSSNPQVAAVDADGVVWFNAAGNATVTAECQGLDFSVPFVVKEVMARALNVFPVEAVGGIGHEFSLLALHEPENTTDKSVTWESSNPEVASVSEDGRVQLASLGSAQITARSGEHTAACAVTVDDTVNLTEMASTGVVIDIVEGGIVVRNAPVGESIAAYSVDGKVVNGAMVESDETRLALAPGIYIVKVSPATVAKVLIKL